MTALTGSQIFNPEGSASYSYDLAGNLTGIFGPGGAHYYYDPLNRLSTVSDANGQTSYGYDNVGNLQTITYPNGLVHSYSLTGYSYLLDAAGHRLLVSELSGRTVNYSYDSIYRLTNETVAADPNGINGAVNYTFDAVGNRTKLTSTLAPIPAGLWGYNANDELTSDVYDANGNTVNSGGLGYGYDFENHLVQKGGLGIVYDGDGNRVAESTASGTTLYLVERRESDRVRPGDGRVAEWRRHPHLHLGI